MLQCCKRLFETQGIPSLLLYRSIRLPPLLSALPRVPLISFPARKGPDGKPLITLSLDNLVKGSSGHTQVKSLNYADLSVGYGRAPFTVEEMDAINSGGAVDCYT
ncbi:PREDICTED: uncharacterized protein LOC109582863 [Amphimedon queenslandica]|uniref:Uncharacterized protein n=1 Tax=Amphimedon queenslandica TaxID=400682 RepID=A0A1X7VVC8_AMPQE|nr:PREDICTED: uncharacterized protein LOC109582863 [Amphimedon queenslandica]|eukprot:XP_019853473.1 PREDICTED: uncharacterized protein LOC109582863 [Amphimedon queenslandica]